MGFSIVTSLVDLPGSPPPVKWRVTLSDENSTYKLVIAGLPSAARSELAQRVGGGGIGIMHSINRARIGEAQTMSVVATPDDLTGAEHPSNALGLLASLVALTEDQRDLQGYLDELLFCGSIAADGTVLPPRNPVALALQARDLGKVLVMERGAAEIGVSVYPGVLGVSHSSELFKLLMGDPEWDCHVEARPLQHRDVSGAVDISCVVGQVWAKKALEVAVAGGHDVIMLGPPGEGKSLLSKTIPGIAAKLSESERLDVACMYHAAGKLAPDELPSQRPLRMVDQTVTKQALLGGGSDQPYPGEVSLSDHGFLVIDEALQCSRGILDALRTVMQDGEVAISRVAWKTVFPARFSLIALANPCLCGKSRPGDESECTCTPRAREAYRAKLSGPLADRLEIRVRVEALSIDEFIAAEVSETSEVVQARVQSAVDLQISRQGCLNARLNPEIEQSLWRGIDKRLLVEYSRGRTTRGLMTMLKLARTCADLRGAEVLGEEDLSLAARLSPDITSVAGGVSSTVGIG